MELAQIGPTTAVEATSADPVRQLLAAFLIGYEGHTRTAYARDLADWLASCDRHGVDPLTAHRAHVDAYARGWLRSRGGPDPPWPVDSQPSLASMATPSTRA